MNTRILSEVTKICTHIGIIGRGKLLLSDSIEGVEKMFAGEKSLEEIYFKIEGDDTNGAGLDNSKNAEFKAYSDIVEYIKSQGLSVFPPKPIIYPLAILQNIVKYASIVGAVLAVFLGFDTFSSEK